MGKFKLKDVQMKSLKKEILADIIIDGEVKEDTPVSWVIIYGTEDPRYKEKILPHLQKYKEEVDTLSDTIKLSEDPDEKESQLEKVISGNQTALNELLIQTVCCSIEDWDEEFFDTPFSKEAAYEIFSDVKNNFIYNQIANWIKERNDFLPHANSQP